MFLRAIQKRSQVILGNKMEVKNLYNGFYQIRTGDWNSSNKLRAMGAEYDNKNNCWKLSYAYRLNFFKEEINEIPLNVEFDEKRLKLKLYPFQKDGVHFLLKNKFAILGDELGLGKTIQTLTALDELSRQDKNIKILIVVPLSLMDKWKSDMDKLLIHPLNVEIINYEKLRKLDSDIFKNVYDVVVFDEASRLRNKSKQKKGAHYLRSERIWLLTGILVERIPTDVYQIISTFINYFSYQHFLDSFVIRQKMVLRTGKVVYPIIGYKNLSLLYTQIAPIYLRRTRKDLPYIKNANLEYEERINECNPFQLSEIKNRVKAMKESINSKDILLKYFQEIRLLLDDTNYKNDNKISSPKFDELKTLLQTINSKVIIFTSYPIIGRKIYNELNNEYKCIEIDGDKSQSERTALLNQFRTQDFNILISSDVLAYGQDIPEANYIIHYDLPLLASVLKQREGRVDRINVVKENIFIIHLLLNSPFEKRIKNIISKKIAYNTVVTDGYIGKEKISIFDEVRKIIAEIS